MSRDARDRRALMEFVLRGYLTQGAKLILPPGCAASSPSLLDAIDVDLLVRQLQIYDQLSHKGGNIDITKCMAPNHLSSHSPPPPRTTNEAISSYSFVNGVLQPLSPLPSPPLPTLSAPNPFASSPSPPPASPQLLTPITSSEPDYKNEPQLSLKELETGLSDEEAKLLTFLTFTLSSGSPQPSSSASQPNPLYQASEALKKSLSIPNDAAEGFKSSVSLYVRDLFPEKRVTLEGLVSLLVNLKPPIPSEVKEATIPPSSSGSFFAFSLLQSTLSSTLRAGFTLNTKEGWTSPDPSESRRILAKMKAALRRLSLDNPDDYDAEDHYEAGQALWMTARSLASKTRMGWKLPWCIRVKICEVMQQALFDSQRVGSGYIKDHSLLLGLYERSIYPPLGISPILSLALESWTHFKQYFASRDSKWLTQLKFAMSKLLSKTHSTDEPSPDDHFGLGQDVIATDANVAESCMDLLLAKRVASSILDHACEKLGDFYKSFPEGGASIVGLLDCLLFASRARGDDPSLLTSLATRLVVTSTVKEMHRRTLALTATANDKEEHLSALLRAAESLMNDQLKPNGQINALAVQTQILPIAASIGALALHSAAGEELMPWMMTISSLSPTVIHLSKEAMRIDARVHKQLMYSVDPPDSNAILFTASTTIARLAQLGRGSLLSWADLSINQPSLHPISSLDAALTINTTSPGRFEFKRWDLMTPLQVAVSAWAKKKCSEIGLWTQRQLEMDSAWRKVSDTLGYGQFAVEVSKVNNDAIDAIFEMGLPVSKDAINVLLSGIDSSFHRCASYILDRLGTISRLVPPLPNPTRYKKEVVVKQELTEQAALEGKPPPSDGIFSRLFAFSSKTSSGTSGYKPEEDDPIATSFLESVPRVETSPDYVNISRGLDTGTLLVAIHSSSFLKDKLEALSASTATRWVSSLPDDHTMQDEEEGGMLGSDSRGGGGGGFSLAMPEPVKGGSNMTMGQSSSNPFASPMPSEAANPFSSPSPSPSPHPPTSPSNGSSWTRTALSRSITALDSSINYSCTFLAHKITFWDMRQIWLERLYRHHVKDRRILQEVLPKIDRSLFESCSLMDQGLRDIFATALFKCSVRAMERVLLDGGPCRWFIPSDVPLIESDLDALCSTFTADGEGLKVRAVAEEAHKVRRLFRLMSMEVGPLIELLKQARASGNASLPVTSSSRGGAHSLPGGVSEAAAVVYEEDIILRVLARRPERLGSKVLKEAPYKLGKKLRM